jgi:hypothetical protein
MPPPRRNSGKDKAPSPIDEKARALAEQEAQLRAKMESCQKLIEEAPKLAEEQRKLRREELINRASRTEARHGSRAALPDRRFGYEANVAAPAQRRRLRAERRQGRLTFFILLLTLAGLVSWAYYTFTHP